MDVKKLGTNDKNESEKKLVEDFDSCLGAIKIITDGWETEAIPEPVNKKGEKIGLLSKMFKNISWN